MPSQKESPTERELSGDELGPIDHMWKDFLRQCTDGSLREDQIANMKLEFYQAQWFMYQFIQVNALKGSVEKMDVLHSIICNECAIFFRSNPGPVKPPTIN